MLSAETRFRAMGTDVHLVVVGGGATALDAARRRIDDLESRWSRFRPTSEISRLNLAAGGGPVAVSADTELLVRRGVAAHALSGGLVDVTLLGAVVSAGYDATFETLTDRPTVPLSPLVRGIDGIEVGDGWARLPEGVGFDPGGVGKGLAADLLVVDLVAAGVGGACVNLGGDLRVTGVAPSGDGWTIDVEHPDRDEPVARLGLHEGAVATSTTRRRRWSVGGEARHHLIDPTTGRPSAGDVELAAVLAGEGWVADVLAKAVLLAGGADPAAVLAGSGAEGLAVRTDGSVVRTAGLAAYS